MERWPRNACAQNVHCTINLNLIVHIMPVIIHIVIKIAHVLYQGMWLTITNKSPRCDRFLHITDYCKKPARESCQPSSVHCVVPFTWSSVWMYSSLMLQKKHQLLKVRLSITLHMHDLCSFFSSEWPCSTAWNIWSSKKVRASVYWLLYLCAL